MNKLFFFVFIVAGLASCKIAKQTARDYPLFQKGLDSLGNVQFKEITLKAGDAVSVQVFTTATNVQDQTVIFNLSGAGDTKNGGGGYTINNNGYIDYPKLGLIKAEGKTTTQLKDTLRQLLSVYVKDVVVAVKLQGIKINVLGEVGSPGAQTFTTERVTILDAVAAAGGLTEGGNRSDVLVIREAGAKREYYMVDFRSAALYNSPVFQLQQNDLIYVRPTALMLSDIQQTAVQKRTQLARTIASFATLALSTTALIISLSNR
jgi:polysaccharide export outer membrane protein